MMSQKLIACLFCREEVKFNLKDNDKYKTHLKLQHNINFHLGFLLKMNLMDKKSLSYIFSKFDEKYEGEEDRVIQEYKSEAMDDFEEDEEVTRKDNSETLDFSAYERQQNSKDDEEQLLIESSLLEDSLNTTANYETKNAEFDHTMDHQEFEEDLIKKATSVDYHEPQNNPVNDELQFDELAQEVEHYEYEEPSEDYVDRPLKTNKQKTLGLFTYKSCTICSMLLIKRVISQKIKTLI